MNDLKGKMARGLIFKTANDLYEALKPAALPEYTNDPLGKPKASYASHVSSQIVMELRSEPVNNGGEDEHLKTDRNEVDANNNTLGEMLKA